MNTHRLLENIGLNPIEVKIYLALLQLGEATVNNIAKETRIKRTTIYPFLDSLRDKGLIEWGLQKYNRKAKSKEPKQLVRFAKAQERKYGRAVLNLDGQIKDIEKLYNPNLKDVEVKYFEGARECREMLLELYNIKGNMYTYSSWMKYQYLGHEWCENFYNNLYKQKGMKNNIQIVSATEHNLWHAKDYVKESRYKKRYFPKFIPPKKYYINIDTFLFNDIKLILSFKNVKPNGIYIKNRDLAQSEKAVFKVLYSDIALEYEEYTKKHKIDLKKLRHKE
ncbi:MAG: helix-turn-helix domain-containing protein [Candidatus Dojkabacteria bacterium]|jgi:sugar-specific transcriptional regulator TrmB|nr:helix-turn-helix domain-containing protein [Candidatus Dojkabacteria bacterium]